MKWYKWATIEDFESWHNQVKSFLNLPKYGENSLTGLVDETTQMTTDYTEAVIESDGVYALVEENIAQQFQTIGVVSKNMPPSRRSEIIK
jgi:hypothetical protein